MYPQNAIDHSDAKAYVNYSNNDTYIYKIQNATDAIAYDSHEIDQCQIPFKMHHSEKTQFKSK